MGTNSKPIWSIGDPYILRYVSDFKTALNRILALSTDYSIQDGFIELLGKFYEIVTSMLKY